MISIKKAVQLLNEEKTYGRPAKYTPEQTKELKLRRSAARSKALQALARLHPEDTRVLYMQALRMIHEEKGLLPGGLDPFTTIEDE